MAKVTDMTTGSPFKKIFFFALPLAIGHMLQTLYALGDTLIVSLSRGEFVVTGINLTSSLIFLVNGFAMGLTAGFGIKLSQFVGAKNERLMRKSVATSLILTTLFSVVLSIIFVILAPNILTVMKTNEQFMEYAVSYIRAIFAGILFTSLYNLSAYLMRAMGDSKTPLIILIVCSFLNIALNSLLFITDFSSAWAGWATVISQAVSAIVGYVIIFTKYKVLRFDKSYLKLSAEFCSNHLIIAIPMAFQSTITAISCMVQQLAFNSLPDPDCVMAQATASKIDNLFSSLLFGSTAAMGVYCGQNYGANKLERIKKGVKASYLMGLIFSAISISMNFIFCKPLSRLLLYGASDKVLDMIFQYISIQSCFYYALCILLYLRESLQGLGKSSLTIIGGITELFMRCFACFVLAREFGFIGACFSNSLAWVGGMICFCVCFNVVIKKMQVKQRQGSIFSV